MDYIKEYTMKIRSSLVMVLAIVFLVSGCVFKPPSGTDTGTSINPSSVISTTVSVEKTQLIKAEKALQGLITKGMILDQ